MTSPRSVSLPLVACFVLACVPPVRSDPPARQETKPPDAAVRPRDDAGDDPLPRGARARLGNGGLHTDGKRWLVTLSPDGREIRLVREDRVEIRDVGTGREVRRFPLPKAEIRYGFSRDRWCAFSPDGRLFRDGDGEGVTVYDAATGKLLAHEKKGFPLFQKAASADGKVVVEGNALPYMLQEATSVTARDVPTSKRLVEIPVPLGHGPRVALSADGKTLAFWCGPGILPNPKQVEASHREIKLFEVASGKELRRFDAAESSVAEAAFSPDGKLLAVTESGPVVSVWEAATGRQVRRWAARRGTGPPLCFSPDGKVVLAGAPDGAVQMWEVATGRRRQTAEGQDWKIWEVRFLAGGEVLAYGSDGEQLHVWDVVSGRVHTPGGGHTSAVLAVAFPSDGKTLVSYSRGSQCWWDLASGKLLRRVARPPGEKSFVPDSLLCSPDGTILVRKPYSSGRLTVAEAASGEELCALGLAIPDHRPLTGAFAADGKTLALLGRASPGMGQVVVRTWDPTTGRVRGTVRGWEADAHALALSADGMMLALASARQDTGPAPCVCLWEVAGGKEVLRFTPPKGVVRIAFSPDGTLLAGGGWDGVVRVWDTATGAACCTLKADPGPRGEFHHLLFSRDGRILAAMDREFQGKDSRIQVWELASGKLRGVFRHPSDVPVMAFCPDSLTLATGGTDTTVLLWDVSGRVGDRLSPRDLDGLWSDLGNEDAQAAHRALALLADAPADAVALIRRRLSPAEGRPPEDRQVEAWVTDLEAGAVETTDKAARALREAGPLARPALLAALAAKPSAEKRIRLVELLGAMSRARFAPERMRPTRALELLERLGTPEAGRLLKELAAGNPSAWLTVEARASLQRMGCRP